MYHITHSVMFCHYFFVQIKKIGLFWGWNSCLLHLKQESYHQTKQTIDIKYLHNLHVSNINSIIMPCLVHWSRQAVEQYLSRYIPTSHVIGSVEQELKRYAYAFAPSLCRFCTVAVAVHFDSSSVHQKTILTSRNEFFCQRCHRAEPSPGIWYPQI